MRARPNPGDEVSFSDPTSSLARRKTGTLVAWEEIGRATVGRIKAHGREYMVSARYIRAANAPRPKPKPTTSAPQERVSVRRGAAELRAVPKPEAPTRSEKYLAFVRSKACASCMKAGPSDPHHFGQRGTGQKTSDLLTVPLCRACHDRFHDAGVLPGTRDRIDTERLIHRAQALALAEFVRDHLPM